MADDLDSTVEQSAQGPRRAAVDGQSAKAHSLPDLIEADKHLARRRAARPESAGLRLPGAC
jgi:hypothetical protein